MDAVFRAIDDRSRRRLLDLLQDEDGRTLGELCAHFPEMTRFGVMNHLRVLEDAGLVTTRKAGRSKLHFLNPVPIREIHDRWISKYAEPVVGRISAIKRRLEDDMTAPVHVYQTFIKATVDEVWKAIVDGDTTVQYFYGTRVDSGWGVGDPIHYLGAEGDVVADGEVLSIDPPTKLEMTFHARWDPELEAEGPVREVWVVAESDGLTRLAVELYDIGTDTKTFEEFTNGFPYIVSGLKTLLETGKALAG